MLQCSKPIPQWFPTPTTTAPAERDGAEGGVETPHLGSVGEWRSSVLKLQVFRLVSDSAFKQASMPVSGLSCSGLPGALIPNASTSNASGIWPHIRMRLLWAKWWLTCLPLSTVNQSHGCKLWSGSLPFLTPMLGDTELVSSFCLSP